MINILTGGRQSGKTTKALQFLDSKGGGVFLTRHPRELMALIKSERLDLKNPDKIIVVDAGVNQVVVDDAEFPPTTLVYTGPKNSSTVEIRHIDD